MLQKTVLAIDFSYNNKWQVTCIRFEFIYDATVQIHLIEKLKNAFETNLDLMMTKDLWTTQRSVKEDDILIVLHALIDIKQACDAKLTASPSGDFQAIVTRGLEKIGDDSDKTRQFFEQNISLVLSVSEREILAPDQKSFVDAFILAQHYRTLLLQSYLKPEIVRAEFIWKMSSNATNWLAQGLEYIKDTDITLTDHINLDDFLSSLDQIRRNILHCDANPIYKQLLLNALIKNTTIKFIILEKQEDLNDFVCALLKSNTSIKELIISIEMNEPLSAQFIARLGEILKINSSLNVIDFKDGIRITTEDFKVILDALAMNPKSKLTSLQGKRVVLNDETANLLLPHLQQHHKLEWVEHWHDLSIDYLNTIKILFSANREHREHNSKKIEGAFVTGSAHGFFSQLRMPEDLGDIMGQYLSKKDAYNLTLVARLPAQKAKKMREEMIEQVEAEIHAKAIL